MEASLLSRAGQEFQTIPAAGVHGVGLRALPGNLLRLARGVPAARRIVHAFDPDVVFFTGGFVGVPVALVARGVPKAIFVPDIEPALALRMISRMADLITVSTEQSLAFYRKEKRAVVTGYPTRAALSDFNRAKARHELGLAGRKKVLLVFGGSRGARSINEALWACLPELLERMVVLHVTGHLDWPRVDGVLESLSPQLRDKYRVHAYLHDEMPNALMAADLVVSRSGAATIGEYPLLGLPAILVPYPYAWRYQKVNADYLVDAGAAVSLADEDLQAKLLPEILNLLDDPDRLLEMREMMKKLATPDAAKAIASELLQLGERGARA
jgi:UDP-N-acetylglucosamine--N-acetylmuramyl-(pentapeptide) pyrophosphoryl-undecaprenol N-acetylglucosamine transferase